MSDNSLPDSSPEPHRLEAARLEKLHRLEALGLDPWGQRFDGHMAIASAREKCPSEFGTDGERVRVAGRIMLQNDRGKLKFFHIQDATGRIQLMISMKDVPEKTWQAIEQLDLGDIVGIDGRLRVTKTGEKTIFVEQLTLLCKSLATPPEKFHGARDI